MAVFSFLMIIKHTYIKESNRKIHLYTKVEKLYLLMTNAQDYVVIKDC